MKKFVIISVLAGTLIVPNVLGSVSADSINSSNISYHVISTITKPQKSSSVKVSSSSFISLKPSFWFVNFDSVTDGSGSSVPFSQLGNLKEGTLHLSCGLNNMEAAGECEYKLPKGLRIRESGKETIYATISDPVGYKEKVKVGYFSWEKGNDYFKLTTTGFTIPEHYGVSGPYYFPTLPVVGVNYLNDLNSSSSSSIKNSASSKSSVNKISSSSVKSSSILKSSSSKISSSNVKSSSNSSSSVNSSAVSTPSSSSVNSSISSELPINQQAHIYADTYPDHSITFLRGFEISNYHYNGQPQTYEYKFMGAIGAHFVGGTSKLQLTITNVFGDKERFIAGEVKGDKNGIVYITIYPIEALKDIRSFCLNPTGIYTVWLPDKSSSSSSVKSSSQRVNDTINSEHHTTKKSSKVLSSSMVSSSKQVNSSSVKSSSILKSSSSKSSIKSSSITSSNVKSSSNSSSSKKSSSLRVINDVVNGTMMSEHHVIKKSSKVSSSSMVSSSKQVNSSRVKSSSINSTSKNGVQSSSTIKGTTQGTNNNTQNDVNTTQSNNTLPETGTKSFNVFEFLIDLFK